MYKNDDNTRNKSTVRQVIFLVIWAVIFCVLLFEVIKFGGYTIGKVDKDEMYLYNFVNNIVASIINKESNVITEQRSLKIASVGNIYATSNIITGAKTGNEYDFTSGYEGVATKLKEYDLVMGSLSTPVAGSSVGYSNNKLYNAPNGLLKTLKSLNISAVATATYRAMDKNIEGIKYTIGNLKEYNINQTGISEDKDVKPLIIFKNDIKLGVLSYATDSNVDISKNNSGYVNIISEKKIKSDIEYLRKQEVDGIIAYLDVPNGDTTVVTSKQKSNTELLFKSGVNIVLCSGSSVVLEDSVDEVELSDKTKNPVYVIYSLGDFLGGYVTSIESASIIPTFEFNKKITKDKNGQIVDSKCSISFNKPIKLWTVVSNSYSKKVYIMDEEIEKFNLDKSSLTNKQYTQMKEQYDRIATMYE